MLSLKPHLRRKALNALEKWPIIHSNSYASFGITVIDAAIASATPDAWNISCTP